GVHVDTASLAFALGLTLATGIVFGLAPAFSAPEPVLHDALKDASRGSTGRRAWIRRALVVSEVAFACVLLVGAGLLMRSFVRVLDVQLGFRPSQAVTVRVDPSGVYSARAKRTPYFDEVLRLVRNIPGVDAAGITDALPLGRNRTWGVGAKGVIYERGKFPSAFPRIVSDGYFAAMGIPLKAGRDISSSDTASSEPVIVVNQTMAERLWPGQDPIDKFVLGACAKERRVVGVVGDVRHLALEQSSGNEMYIPLRQCNDQPSSDLVVRSTLADGAISRAVRAALQPIAPTIGVNEFRPLQRLVDRSVSPRRFTLTMLGAFAVFALILASLGIYALISYSVNQRTQEIGIRMALGASAGDVQARIVGQTLGLAATGMVIGVAASWLLARSLKGLLYGVTATDPVTFAVMLCVLTVVATLAGYFPARRASRIDPLVALRVE
ncbi:MAG TPA: FtsX-like permease family protein, partial [Vicinamibacterales bacterium]